MLKRICNILRSLWNHKSGLLDTKLNEVLMMELAASDKETKISEEKEVIEVLYEMKNQNFIKHLSKSEITEVVKNSHMIVKSHNNVNYTSMILDSIINNPILWGISDFKIDQKISISLKSNKNVSVSFIRYYSDILRDAEINFNGVNVEFKWSRKINNACKVALIKIKNGDVKEAHSLMQEVYLNKT